MSQTNTIILRFDDAKAAEFERMFEEEVMPLWRKFKTGGKFISASLTPVQDGNQMKKGVRTYILHVEVPSMAEHSAFDSNPDFNRFLPRAQALQVEEPAVLLGETLFQV
ncbi:MAG: hypothetical protein OK438_08675 [Thaumarchaeota archaeon]|nr:hypothetical protein [Nitrososphaerota archaeon]